MENLTEELLTKVSDKLYSNYTLCELKTAEKDIIDTIIKMADEVDTGFNQIDIMLKVEFLKLTSYDFIIENDEYGFFKQLKIKVE